MTPVLKMIEPGFQTTLQDKGRHGFQEIGIPGSGPLDAIAFRLANALVGNQENTAALEILVQAPVLEVVAESLCLALVGGSAGIALSGEPEHSVPMGVSFVARRGDVLRIKPLKQWPSAYLAIEGGFTEDTVMGSASTYTRASLGGKQGRALIAGDILQGKFAEAAPRTELALGRAFEAGVDQPIRIVMGPQADMFTDGALEKLVTRAYSVLAQADRMGFRLEGEPLHHKGSYDLVSDGIVPGSIQVPGTRQPIVMMVDHQTTGGYPKIATVISADIPVLGRRLPGNPVRFQAVSRTEAEDIRRQQEAMLSEWISALKSYDEVASVNLDRLYDANLVGGVQNALD